MLEIKFKNCYKICSQRTYDRKYKNLGYEIVNDNYGAEQELKQPEPKKVEEPKLEPKLESQAKKK